jgi:hypothetical protein
MPAAVRRARIQPPREKLAGLMMNGARVNLGSMAQVPPGHNQLEIQFAALTYRDRSLLKYQYRLHSNDEWTDSASNLRARATGVAVFSQRAVIQTIGRPFECKH